MLFSELPEEQKALLINDGISFIRSVTEVYGNEEGLVLWEKISTVIDPDLKGQIFFKLLTGDFDGKVHINGSHGIRSTSKYFEIIKTIRNYSGLGLKEAKDMTDLIDKGNRVSFNLLGSKERREFIRNIQDVGLTAF